MILRLIFETFFLYILIKFIIFSFFIWIETAQQNKPHQQIGSGVVGKKHEADRLKEQNIFYWFFLFYQDYIFCLIKIYIHTYIYVYFYILFNIASHKQFSRTKNVDLSEANINFHKTEILKIWKLFTKKNSFFWKYMFKCASIKNKNI